VSANIVTVDIPELVDPPEKLPDPVISLLKTIKVMNEALSLNKKDALQQIAEARKQISDLSNNGKIEKTVYEVLDKAILRCVNEINKY